MRASLFAAALVFVPSVAHAQAWTRDAGSAYVNLSLTRLSGDSLYNPDFTRSDLPTTFTQTLINTYAEVGVVDRWLTVTLSSELYRRNALDQQGATFGLGDTQVGFWSGVITAPFRLTLGVNVGLPTGDDTPDATDPTDVEAQSIARSLPTGDGEFDFEPAVYLGHGFGGDSWPLRHFVVAKLGYHVRTRGFRDAVNYKLELGTQVPVDFLDRFWLITRFYGTESFASDIEAANGATGLGNGVTYTSLGVELSGRITGGLSAGIGVDTAFRARSIIAAIPFRFSIAYEL